MIIERTPAGEWRILAPWLDEPVTALTFEEAYELALRARTRRGASS
jgi:hypothetical protein